jgi:hypothetical protein
MLALIAARAAKPYREVLLALRIHTHSVGSAVKHDPLTADESWTFRGHNGCDPEAAGERQVPSLIIGGQATARCRDCGKVTASDEWRQKSDVPEIKLTSRRSSRGILGGPVSARGPRMHRGVVDGQVSFGRLDRFGGR